MIIIKIKNQTQMQINNLIETKPNNFQPLSKIQLIELNTEMFKVLVNADIQRKVNYLHSKYPGLEWGGFLFYTTNQAENIKDLIITLVDFYPLDLGHSAFTSYTQTPAFAGFIADNPEYMSYNMGIIHSHHNMGAFHSGTDISTLREQVEHFRNFLSVVVDTRRTWDVRLAKYETLEYVQTNRNTYDYSNFLVSLKTTKDEKIVKEVAYVYKGVYEYDDWDDISVEFKSVADNLKRNIAHDTDMYGNPVKGMIVNNIKVDTSTSPANIQFRSNDDLNKAANDFIQKDNDINWTSPGLFADVDSDNIEELFNAAHSLSLKSFTDDVPIEINLASFKLLIWLLADSTNLTFSKIKIDEGKIYENWERVLHGMIVKTSGKLSNGIEQYSEIIINVLFKLIEENEMNISEESIMAFSEDLEWISTACTQRKHGNLVSELIDNLYEAVSSYVNDVLFPEDEEDTIEDTIEVKENNPFTTQSFQQYVNIADSVEIGLTTLPTSNEKLTK